ncbi:carbohydrate-binding domain-containing protein [Acetobacterium bakii]|nr:carbohydrate-binding domain-containing protein [Acetobacterium bakii]
MKRVKIFIPFLIIIMLLFSGCNSAASTTTGVTAADTGTETTKALTAVISPTSAIVVDPEFTERDLETIYEDSTATHVTLDGSNIQVTGDGAVASNGVLTITAEGTYVITGNLTDGQIVVAAADTDKIQIVLNGAAINCADNAPIYVKSANKVFVTLNAGTVNTLTDGTVYVQTDENTVDAVIFSKADLTLNGEGTLNITSIANHGIVSKDDLVITGGTYTIISANDALSGKNSVKIKDGIFNITCSSEGKGITSKNDEDTTKGYVYIAGGTITITKSYEGIEGTVIIVEGGTFDITAQDDGFNTASASASNDDVGEGNDPGGAGGGGGAMENDANCYLSIAGGTINLNASGDGLDSNGNLYISGGDITVSGPTNSGNGALDYNGIADITGGTVVISGSTGMAQGFSESSTQASLLYNLTSACEAGTEIKLTDDTGKTIASYTPDKTYQSVVISTPEMVQGSTYTLTCGSQTVDIPLTAVVTSNGQSGMGGPGQGGGQGGGTRPQ